MGCAEQKKVIFTQRIHCAHECVNEFVHMARRGITNVSDWLQTHAAKSIHNLKILVAIWRDNGISRSVVEDSASSSEIWICKTMLNRTSHHLPKLRTRPRCCEQELGSQHPYRHVPKCYYQSQLRARPRCCQE